MEPASNSRLFGMSSATFSGATDMIAVSHPDGSIRSSPFYVRFGKFQSFSTRNKQIWISVNGKQTPFVMRVQSNGSGYFYEPDFEKFKMRQKGRRSFIESILSVSGEKNIDPESIDLAISPKKETLLDPKEFDKNKVAWEEFEQSTASVLSNNSLQIRVQGRIMTPQIFKASFKGSFMENKANSFLEGVLLLKKGFKDKTKEALWEIIEKNIKENPGMAEFLNSKNQANLPEMSGNMKEFTPNVFEEASASSIFSESRGACSLESKNSSVISTASVSTENSNARSFIQWGEKGKKRTVLPENLMKEFGKYLELHHKNTIRYSMVKKKGSIGNWKERKSLEAFIYFYPSSAKIVCSDIDGTLTKSDFRGQVLSRIGFQYAHPGVSKLFQEVKRLGYQVIYLTNRPIGDTGPTKKYLKSVNQEGVCLPDGPLFTSPHGTITALKNEVILGRGEQNKIESLLGIKEAFGGENPFVLGFGNKDTDVRAYLNPNVGFPNCFLINSKGELELITTVSTSSDAEEEKTEDDEEREKAKPIEEKKGNEGEKEVKKQNEGIKTIKEAKKYTYEEILKDLPSFMVSEETCKIEMVIEASEVQLGSRRVTNQEVCDFLNEEIENERKLTEAYVERSMRKSLERRKEVNLTFEDYPGQQSDEPGIFRRTLHKLNPKRYFSPKK